jgi:DNA replicative helicase MCM subunit Mcm2 (Cdc46/Mcm family)
MAEASARIRLADIATVEDVERAIRLTRTWRNELMGENFDETALHTGKKATARNSERIFCY